MRGHPPLTGAGLLWSVTWALNVFWPICLHWRPALLHVDTASLCLKNAYLPTEETGELVSFHLAAYQVFSAERFL